MKYFFILICIFILSCSRYIMLNEIHGDYHLNQIDSILNIEKIPTDLTIWHTAHLKDFETNDSIYQYVYIKNLGKNQIIYNIIKQDTIYTLSKRITKKNN